MVVKLFEAKLNNAQIVPLYETENWEVEEQRSLESISRIVDLLSCCLVLILIRLPAVGVFLLPGSMDSFHLITVPLISSAPLLRNVKPVNSSELWSNLLPHSIHINNNTFVACQINRLAARHAHCAFYIKAAFHYRCGMFWEQTTAPCETHLIRKKEIQQTSNLTFMLLF